MLVTLASGADPNRLLRLLFERKTTVVNYYGKLGSASMGIGHAPVLRNQIQASDIDRPVFKPRM